MKKVLALVLAFAMMFSTITVAFAETEVSAEAKALATVGMLEGDGNGVTAEYTAKEMTRFTAAISLLKLKGLYNDALAFKGDANFADVDTVKWAEGKNILAYLKANPGLGFGGNEKGEFNPNGNINEQSYYKVLLETLGYKQTTAEVAGDFAWAEVLEFAEKVGLKPAKAEKFTVDELAKATVAALKAKMKDGKVLINVLVDGGKVDKDKALAAGLMEEAVLTVAVKSAKAIGNTVVEVTFADDVEKAAAEKVENYSITGLEIKSATLVASDVVRLETAAQTAGKAYVLVVGDKKVNFGGLAKVSGAPEFKKATGTDTETVELEFDKALDFATATDVSNYEIKDIKIVTAELDGSTVTLTTEGLVANKSYSVKASNVKSIDGVALKSATKSFVAKTDKVAPKLASAVGSTNTRLIAKFSELVTKASATDVANFTIKTGSTELEIVEIKDITKSGATETTIEITTAPQKSGTKYELIARDIVDKSVLANKMVKESKQTFYGQPVDKNAPTVLNVEYLSKTKVYVEFNDRSRLDKDSATDVNNYSMNNDIVVEEAKMADTDADCKAVILTVSELSNKSYTLTITDVKDEYENAIKKETRTRTFNASNLVTTSVEKVNAYENIIEITFSRALNSDTAKDVANYEIDGDMGTPVKASYKSKKVTLTLGSDLKAGKSYKVTIDNVLDLADNVVKAKASFIASATKLDTDKPVVENIQALNDNVVEVTFSEPMKLTGTITLTDYTTPTAETINLECVDSNDDDTVLYFVRDDANDKIFTGLTTDSYGYVKVAYNNVADKAGNVIETPNDELLKVYANADPIDAITFESWDQTKVNEFKLIFSGKIDENTLVNLSAVTGISGYTGYTAATFTTRLDEDDASIVYLVNNGVKSDKNYMIEIPSSLKGLFKQSVKGEKEESGKQYVFLSGGLEDTDVPFIENVEAVTRTKVVVTYNEDLKPGTFQYEIKDENDKLIQTTALYGQQDSKKANKVNITLTSSKLEAGKSYTLYAKTRVYDLSNNRSDENEEFTFEGTNVVNNVFLTVNVENANTIKVFANGGTLASVTEVVYGTGAGEKWVAGTDFTVDPDDDGLITLNSNVFVKDKDYTVKAVVGSDTYQATFKGMAEVEISGNVTKTGGAVLEDVKVTVKNAAGDVIAVVYTDNAGDYSVVVIPGTYKLEFSKTGYTSDSINSIAVGHGDATGNDIVLNVAP